MLGNNPRCAIPENLPESDLFVKLQTKGLPTNLARSDLDQMLRTADRSMDIFKLYITLNQRSLINKLTYTMYSKVLAFVMRHLIGYHHKFATVYPVIYCRKKFDLIKNVHFVC